MTEMKAYWHIHHDVLVEFSGDIEERIRYIKTHKPAKEVPLRLRLLKPVQGKLPDTVIKAGVTNHEASVARDKARVAYDKAWVTRDKTRASCDKAGAAYYEASMARDKAGAVLNETLDAHQSEIEALHAQECPDCPWNGKTIFPGK